MKTWDQFLRDVMPYVPGCPEPVAEHALLRAAQDFCAGTQVWKIWLDDITTVADVLEYDLNLELRSELVRLERATLDGRPVVVTTEEVLPVDWKTSTAGIGTCIFTVDRKTITLLPAQTADLVLKVQACLKPSDTAEGVENFIFDQYARQIACGAKASLMMQPGKTYSNPGEGASLEAEFNGAIGGVGFQRWRGFSSARPRARLSTF